MEHAVLEIALVIVAIELELSGAGLFTIGELTSKLNGVLVPAFDTFAMIEVVFPLTLIPGTVIELKFLALLAVTEIFWLTFFADSFPIIFNTINHLLHVSASQVC